MAFKLAADAVVVVHLLWILFIMLGALVGCRVAWVKWLHLSALGFSLCLQLFGWICPLTDLEVWLRRQHDPSLAYPGDFLAHYAQRLVYLPAPRETVFMATLIVMGASAWAYWPRERKTG